MERTCVLRAEHLFCIVHVIIVLDMWSSCVCDLCKYNKLKSLYTEFIIENGTSFFVCI